MKTLLKSKTLMAAALASALGFASFSALAAPASDMLHTMSQPDGSTFGARQWGNAYLSGWENAEGYSVIFDTSRNAWTYAVRDAGGALVSSGQIVGQATPPAPAHLRPTGKALGSALGRSRQGFASMPAGIKTVTPRGTGNTLTVLVNFADTKPTYTKANFDSTYFAASDSLGTYFTEQSRGAFTLSAGPSGVVDWITLAKGHDYYGRDESSANKDLGKGEIAQEVVAALNKLGIDFAAYDGNGDCYVDALSIIFQGVGQHESGNVNDIWPTQSYEPAPGIETTSNCSSGGKIKVSNITYQAEISNSRSQGGMSGYTTFAHEYGHALGLPDLYDTTYKSDGAGHWTLMSDGESKNGDGKPIGLDAWSKLRLGWVTPTMVTSAQTDVTIEPVLTSGKVYQFGTGTQDSGEYFLVENRALVGSDKNLKGGGLLVWHIDGGVVKAMFDTNKVNDAACIPGAATCATQHFGVALVQADNLWNLEKKEGTGDAGDPFPGSSNVTSITDNTAPSMKLYSGAPSGAAICNIRLSGNNVVASLDPASNGTCPTSTATVSSDSDRLFNWAEFKFPQLFPKGATTQTLQGYNFRFYAGTGNYLATKDNRVIVHNGRDWNLLDVGAIADFLPMAAADKF